MSSDNSRVGRDPTHGWHRGGRRWAVLILLVALLSACSEPAGPVTLSGTVEDFETLMTAFMSRHDIEAGALGIMRNGDIVFERGFGWKDVQRQVALPPDAMMRLASVSKPITAAAIRALVVDGLIQLDDRAFDVGQASGGLLPLDPFPTLGDARLADVTVLHLLQHRGGWDRAIAGDLTYREIDIADAMSVASPPGRINTVRYILGQPLEFTPGSSYAYSNIGFLVLGLVIEEVTGRDYLSYVFETVLEPLGVPPADFVQGRTFLQDRDEREPWYDHSGTGPNVFDPTGPPVRLPDGSWHHEARIAQGGLVAPTRTILEFLDVYQIAGEGIGTRRSGSEGSGWRWNHTGSLPGTNTLARQRGDGINYVVLFNSRPSSGTSYSTLIRSDIDAILDAGDIPWPR